MVVSGYTWKGGTVEEKSRNIDKKQGDWTWIWVYSEGNSTGYFVIEVTMLIEGQDSAKIVWWIN